MSYKIASKIRIAWLLPLVAVAAIVTGFATHKSRAKASPHQDQVQIDKKSDIEVEVVKLTPNGFEPKDIQRSEGRVLMVFHNLLGKQLPKLQLQNDQTGSTSALAQNPSAGDQSATDTESLAVQTFREEFIELKAGDYTIRAADHPDWLLHIKITAKQ